MQSAISIEPVRSNLVAESMKKIREFFKSKTQHKPSLDMYQALEDIVNTLSAMAEGDTDQKIYLSSLDPGVGKTTAITAFVETLVSAPKYSHVGVMICVARLDEISSMINRLCIQRESVAVLTSNDEINKLGGANVNEAQVLFTTQQRLENRLNGSDFSKSSEFFFNGEVRDVRIWDETWLPGKGVTINRDAISSMFQQLRPYHPKLTARLDALASDLKIAKDNSKLSLPDFEQEYGVDLNSVLSVFDDTAVMSRSVSSLWYMSGKTVTVRKDDALGNVMLTYQQTLPDDLAPMLVLDASGRVRGTYKDMEMHRGNIIRLTTAVKHYDNLNLHVWTRGGGKSSWVNPDSFREKVDGIASTIRKKSDEEWLIVMHKPKGKLRSVQKAVIDLVGEDVDISKLHFIHWGRHMATNEYANVSNVILAGTLFFRPSDYEALGRLAADRHPSLNYTSEEQKRIEKGEHLHGILQALCRGSVRQCREGVCAPCDAYVIASVNSGIPAALTEVFPRAKLHEWRPIGRVIKGQVKEALAYIDDCVLNGIDVIKFSDVKKAIGIKDSSNFNHNIRQHSNFKAEVAERGLVEWGRNRKTAFRNLGELLGFEDES